MRRIIALLILCLSLASMSTAWADGKDGKRPDRKEWFKQMRNYKHNFLTKELCLTKEQQEKFFPVYDEMEGRLHAVQHDAMDFERKINTASGNVSDLEYEKAAEAMMEVKGKEAEIESRYFVKFKGILSAKQLFQLRQAERKFTREIMKQHSRMQEKQPKK